MKTISLIWNGPKDEKGGVSNSSWLFLLVAEMDLAKRQ